MAWGARNLISTQIHAFQADTSWSSGKGPGEIMTAASLPTSSSCAVERYGAPHDSQAALDVGNNKRPARRSNQFGVPRVRRRDGPAPGRAITARRPGPVLRPEHGHGRVL